MEVTTDSGKRNYRPFNRRLIIEQDEASSTWGKTDLIIPDSVKQKPSSGKVVQVSNEECGINVGDIVLFPPTGGLPIKLDDKEYLLLHELEVIMIGEEGDDLTK